MARKNTLNVTCKCGLIWNIPLGEGKGSSEYNFQCGGNEGCRRYMSVYMENNNVTSVSGAKKYKSIIGGLTVLKPNKKRAGAPAIYGSGLDCIR